MSERLSTDEQRALQSAVQNLNEKAWGIGARPRAGRRLSSWPPTSSC